MDSKLRELKEQANIEAARKMTPEERLIAFCNLSEACAEIRQQGLSLSNKMTSNKSNE